MKRIISSVLITLILALPLLSVVCTNAYASNTFEFNATELHRVSKSYAESPNTFEAIVNFPASTPSSTRGGVILGNYGSGNPNVSFEVYTNGNPRLYVTDAYGGVTDIKFTSVNLYTGIDTHVAIVRDTSVQKAYCYINGSLAQTVDCTNTASISTGAPLILGGDYRGSNEQYFKGRILSVALCASARSAMAIQSDYLNGFSINSSGSR